METAGGGGYRLPGGDTRVATLPCGAPRRRQLGREWAGVGGGCGPPVPFMSLVPAAGTACTHRRRLHGGAQLPWGAVAAPLADDLWGKATRGTRLVLARRG